MKWLLPHPFRVWLGSIACQIFDVHYAGRIFEFSSKGTRTRGEPRTQIIFIGDSLIGEFNEWYVTQPRVHLSQVRYEDATQFVGGGEYFKPISGEEFVAFCAGDASPAVARWPLDAMVEWLRRRHTPRVLSFRTLVEYPVRHFIANRLAPKRRGPRA